MDYQFTSRNGAADESRVVAEMIWGDDHVVVESVGVTDDADAMLAGRVLIWTRAGVTFATGLIYDAARWIVSCGEPLPAVAADALELEGFGNVASFRAS